MEHSDMDGYIDISVGITESIVTWPGAPSVRFTTVHDMDHGDEATDSNIFMNIHTATHIDAPSHFVSSGKTVDRVPLEILMGEAYVAEVPGKNRGITWEDLEDMDVPESVERLLLKTSNSFIWSKNSSEFEEDFVALSETGAQWMVSRGVKLVGIDYLSIQRFHDGPQTHKILLESEVVIVEGLNLDKVSEGFYELICLPIKLMGLEGAPARAVLRKI